MSTRGSERKPALQPSNITSAVVSKNKDRLRANYFLPDLMLPSWFVTDKDLKVRRYNEELLSLVQGVEHADGLLTSPLSRALLKRATAKYFHRPHETDSPSIWRLLLDDSHQGVIAELLAVADTHRRLVNSFKANSDPKEDIEDLVEALQDTGSSSKTVTVYATMPDFDHTARPQFLRAGVRVAPAGGLRSRVWTGKEEPDPYEYVSIVAAWRIFLDWEGDTVTPTWYGMQPAIHDASAQHVDRNRDRYEPWLRNIGGIKHGIGEHTNDIINVLQALDRLFSEIEVNPRLRIEVGEIIEGQPELSQRMEEWSKGIKVIDPSQRVPILREAVAIAREFTQQHADLASFMTDLGDLLQLRQGGVKEGPPEALKIRTPELIQQIAEDFSRRKLRVLSWRNWEVAPEVLQRPIEFSSSPSWRPIEFRSKALFTFTLVQLLDNAWTNSSLKSPLQLTVSQEQEKAGILFKLQVANDLPIRRVNEDKEDQVVECDGVLNQSCDVVAKGAEVYRIKGGRYLCTHCLRRYYEEVLGNPETFARTGHGSFMIKSVIDGWRGRSSSPKEIFRGWGTELLYHVWMGYSVPPGESSWQLMEI